jgi:hypothetical protein
VLPLAELSTGRNATGSGNESGRANGTLYHATASEGWKGCEPMASLEEVRELKRRHSARLLQVPGISGVGIEKDEAGDYVLVIHLDAATPEGIAEVPDRIEGVPVRVVRSGPFRKF